MEVQENNKLSPLRRALLVGLILEAGQIALQSRNPSLTDVLLFGGAAWTGAVIFGRYRRIWDSRT